MPCNSLSLSTSILSPSVSGCLGAVVHRSALSSYHNRLSKEPSESLCFTDLLAWGLWHCVACLFSSAAGLSCHGCPRPHSCSNPSRVCRLLSFFKSNFDGAADVKFRQMLFQRRSIPSSFLDLLADGRTTRRQLHVSSSASEALFEDLPSRYNMLQTMLG